MGLYEKIRQEGGTRSARTGGKQHKSGWRPLQGHNPYSLLQVFRRGHLITKSGVVAYVTRCNLVEVLPWVSLNCMEEIPVI
jgi:hypothetical protein